jgi:membrane protease YdiL (CAAX protease family)
MSAAGGAAGVGAAVWIVYVLLALSIATAWAPATRVGAWRIAAWAPPYLAAVAAALIIGVITPVGVLVLAVLVGLGMLCVRLPRERAGLRAALQVVLGLLMLPLALHLLPGFNNPKLLDAVLVSEAAPPFTQYLNFDKGSAGLILLAFLNPLASTAQHWREALRIAALVGLPTVIATAAAGLLLGYFALDPKVPPQIAGLVLAQLFFICAAEEAFFRGFVQERLHRAWSASPPALATGAPAVIATALFAAVHAAGGWQLVLLAFVSGAGAAIAYARTRTVEAPILIHFAVNATHLFVFTYPYQR